MIVNKLDQQMKDSMNKRVRTGLLMLVYGLIILFCLTLSDKSSNGWAGYLQLDAWVSFIFAVVSVLGIAWITVFIAKELHYCFVGTNNKNQIIFLAIIMLLIQLVPTFIWLYPNYFSVHHKLIWFLAFILSIVILPLIAVPFLYHMVKCGKKTTKFNKVMLPLCVIGITLTFAGIYYLGIVRYWTTILILITAVVACDITAYFAGVLFGKHKMAPVISPKKSWEGAIIGSITAASIVILFVFLFSLIPYKEIQHVATGSMNVPYNFFGVQFQNHFDNTYLQKAWWLIISIIAISLTFFSILGDLLFSWFKRKNHIKDFGSSLPGHGGYLDRIDSFVVVIAVFTIITFVISIGTTIYNHDNFHLIFPNWYK